MTPLEWLGLIIASAAGIAVALFRTYYMPKENMPSLDREPLDEHYIPTSPPPVMAPDAPKQPATATSTPETMNDTKRPTITDFCAGLKEYEGWILPGGKDWSGKVYPKGSRAYQNCSPGNVRYSPVGYLPKYLPVLKDKDGFAKFKDVTTGELYLNEMVKAKIRKNPNQTILQFMEIYAPREDENDPVAYSNFLAKKLGVDNSYRMGDLV